VNRLIERYPRGAAILWAVLIGAAGWTFGEAGHVGRWVVLGGLAAVIAGAILLQRARNRSAASLDR